MRTDWSGAVDRHDALALSQGTVEYGRAEFHGDTFRRLVEVNLNSLGCWMHFRLQLNGTPQEIASVALPDIPAIGVCDRPRHCGVSTVGDLLLDLGGSWPPGRGPTEPVQ
jgi:hypothetical protein